MIKQYKPKEINKSSILRKEVFVTFSDATDLFERFVELAVKAGADPDKLMELVNSPD